VADTAPAAPANGRPQRAARASAELASAPRPLPPRDPSPRPSGARRPAGELAPRATVPASGPCDGASDDGLTRLAYVYSVQRHTDEARTLMDCVVARAARQGGATSVEAAYAHARRARIALQGGALEDAARDLEFADSVLRRLLPRTDTLRADVELYSGLLALRRARPDSALKRFESAHAAWVWAGGPHPRRAAAACGIGLSLALLGRAEQATPWQRPFCDRQHQWGRAYASLVDLMQETARLQGSPP
jgi:hypothetical protein